MSRVGRNEPCPCGSGRKFKKCCGRAGADRSASQLRLVGRSNTATDAPVGGSHLRVFVSLVDAEPPIWRRFLIRADASFYELHEAIQSLGWTNSHLWHFCDAGGGGAFAGIPEDFGFEEPDPDAKQVPLSRHLRQAGDRCMYVYDFGDDWVHEVILEGAENHDRKLDRVLLDGSGAFPPEDCGGLGGFERIQKFLATGVDEWEEEDSLRTWLGDYRLDRFDLAAEQRRFAGAVDGGDAGAVEAPELPAASPERMSRQLDRATVRQIMDHADRMMGDLGDQLGLAIRVRKSSFSHLNAKIELEVATVRDDGLVMRKEAEDFLLRCEEFGFRESDLGREFRDGKEAFRIVGLRPRAKAPVICERIGPPGAGLVRMAAAGVRSRLD